MRREGRVTGYVRRRIVDSGAAKEPYEEEEPQEVIRYLDRIKLLNQATNQSKHSGRCRRPGCRHCHACPTSKALAKTKGRNKPRCSWNNRGRNRLAHLDISLRNLCALKAQMDDYDAADNGENCDSECDEYKNVDDPKEHHITPVSENLSSMNGDSVHFRGEGDLDVPHNHQLHRNCMVHDAESASESITDPNEPLIMPVSENLCSMNGDSVHFRGEGSPNMPPNHRLHQNCNAHDAENGSKLFTDNCIDDFVLIDKYNMAQGHPNSLPVSQKEPPYICFHRCDSNGSAEWYKVADDADDDEDDWHLIID